MRDTQLTRKKTKREFQQKTLDRKIQKQIGPSYMVSINNRKQEWVHMNATIASQKTRKKFHGKVFERIIKES